MPPLRIAALITAAGLLASACGSTAQVGGSGFDAAQGPPGAGEALLTDDDMVLAPLVDGEVSGGRGPSGGGFSGALGASAEALGTQSGRSAARGDSSSDAAASPSPGFGDGRGVEDGKVRIGIITADSSADEQFEAAGFAAYTVGNPEANWRALFADMNERGGLGGLEVEPVFYFFQDITGTNAPAEFQTACARFTQDQPVFLALSDIIFDATFASCLQRAEVPLVYMAGSPLDGAGMRDYALTSFVASANLSRAARVYANGLADMGFFQAQTPATQPVIGLVRVDDAPYARAADEDLKPALARHGLEIAEEVAVTPLNRSGGVGAMTAQLSNAVLRFRTRGVTHVLFLSINATEPVLFMQAAESQGYRPRYGLSSAQFPAVVASLVPASQLRGSAGTGWLPMFDVDTPQDPGASASRARCAEMMAEAGRQYGSRSEEAVGYSACEGGWFAEAAITRGGAFQTGAFLQGVASLGESFPTALGFGLRFGPDRRDGAAIWRPFAFQDDCSCFAYTGGNRPLP